MACSVSASEQDPTDWFEAKNSLGIGCLRGRRGEVTAGNAHGLVHLLDLHDLSLALVAQVQGQREDEERRRENPSRVARAGPKLLTGIGGGR